MNLFDKELDKFVARQAVEHDLKLSGTFNILCSNKEVLYVVAFTDMWAERCYHSDSSNYQVYIYNQYFNTFNYFSSVFGYSSLLKLVGNFENDKNVFSNYVQRSRFVEMSGGNFYWPASFEDVFPNFDATQLDKVKEIFKSSIGTDKAYDPECKYYVHNDSWNYVYKTYIELFDHGSPVKTGMHDWQMTPFVMVKNYNFNYVKFFYHTLNGNDWHCFYKRDYAFGLDSLYGTDLYSITRNCQKLRKSISRCPEII